MSAISDNLIHFLARSVKNDPSEQFKIFKLIIENGLKCSDEVISFRQDSNFYNKVICFTDIPLQECNEHTSKYGKFGIGFKKSYVKRVGGNPISYFVNHYPVPKSENAMIAARGALLHNLMLRDILFNKLHDLKEKEPTSGLLDKAGNEIFSSTEIAAYCNVSIFCSSFYKRMDDLGTANDETKEIDMFYKEREWRIIPSKLTELAGMCDIKPDEGFYFSFERNDLNMIVVPNEQIRRDVLDYFLGLKISATDNRLKEFGKNIPPIVIYDDLQSW